MFKKYALILSVLTLFIASFNASACDDKACESAYLAETKRYVENQIRRAEATKAERHAYSKNRQRRAYALYVHIHFMLFGSDLDEKPNRI
ncbi:hypothetical protein GCM10009133_27200 [Cocleimonas flava]|uniref:Uncharacterized protein n=1 Tax=Cocleimonas flava TaxID=634765 RepID=A0A4R1EPM1_9GAMM|nr:MULTISPECIES: hypothetical protein [Cocleimonas]MEB8432830.1 hypothetical protein [Cocleimonas sp. KMM 6892]MEC4715689.1 hypothetical protein [Cocleimonas sp. KMM 6895]MEC4744693.1 hypothetical protein [Cocleimonas sp. KMM 6896]TCJ83256.1 hypothetical protein EV695_3996 [Cocleimonas flava]